MAEVSDIFTRGYSGKFFEYDIEELKLLFRKLGELN
jgi:hypothetical protein